MKVLSLSQSISFVLAGCIFSSASLYADTVVYTENGGLEFDHVRASADAEAIAWHSDTSSLSTFVDIEPVTTALHGRGDLVEQAYAASIGFSQDLGDQSLHVAGYSSPEAYEINAGLGLGKTTFSIGMGQGSENAWLARERFAANNEFKYGFSPAAYDYQGVNLHYQANENVSFSAGKINVDVEGRVASDVYTAGLGVNDFSADMLSVQ